MKHRGCSLEFERQRNSELLTAYRLIAGKLEASSVLDICARVVEMPASRFWVSEGRAAIVIGLLREGKELCNMSKNKKEMFMEIYRRAKLILSKTPNLSMQKVAFIVVNQPAPKFYLTPSSAKIIYYKAKRQWNELRKQKHQHS